MKELLNDILSFLKSTGLAKLIADPDWWKVLLMYVIVGILVYLAVVKKFEPLLLLPIAFGMFLANLPGAELIHLEYFFDEHYLEKYFFTEEHFNLQMLLDLAKQMTQYLPDLTEAVEGLVNRASFVTNDEEYLALFKEVATLLSNNISANHLAAICSNHTLAYTSVTSFSNAVSASLNQLAGGDVTVKALMANAPDWASHILNSSAHVRYSMIGSEAITEGGLIDILYLGVKLGIYPSLIFMGVGAMTDFSPLISNPKSLLMGAGAQFGVFAAFFFALILGFTPMEAGAIGIIGGADGPTAILVTKELAPQLLGAIAIAAYSYMALIPIIQPPFMKLLTTPEERKIRMSNLRPVSQTEKVIFPIIVTLLVVLVVPDAAPLIGFLMLGNLFNVTGVTDRLSKTAQNELCNIVTIFLGVSVGATASASNFLSFSTIKIIILGLCAFILSTCGGLLTGKIMCKLSGGKINPLIGSAGVSAVPMAARVSQDVGRKEDPSNFLLMHAMGPNVAGVIGSAVAAGVFLSFLR